MHLACRFQHLPSMYGRFGHTKVDKWPVPGTQSLRKNIGSIFDGHPSPIVCAVLAPKLDLLFWTVRPDSPPYLQDCTMFFTKLSNVYSEIKNDVLLSYFKLPLPQGFTQGIPLSLIQ